MQRSEPICGQPAHAHEFRAATSTTEEHRHILIGFTFPVNGSSTDGHVHTFSGATYPLSDHVHRFEGVTGPAIPLDDGSHYHELSGTVDRQPLLYGGNVYTFAPVPPHTHAFTGITGKGLGYPPEDW